MSQVQVDFNLAQQLRALAQPAEICDPSGNVIGKYVPAFIEDDWECVTPDISPEELKRRLAYQGKGYTTAEVLARLESLRCSK